MRRFDRIITIQRKTSTASESGEPIDVWSALVLRRPATMSAVRGDERFSSPQINATDQVEFRIRHSDDVADLSPLDRIIYPALSSGGDNVQTRWIYDIVSVPEIGRREGLRIIANRRPDVFVNETLLET
jgi:head-tail adaptor